MPGIYNGLLQLDGIKMVNQLLAGVHIALAAEAMAFGARLGLILLQLVGVSEEKLITLLEQINNQTTRQTKVTWTLLSVKLIMFEHNENLETRADNLVYKKIKITLHKLIMALPYSFATTTKSSVFSKLHNTSFFQHNQLQRANVVTVVKCESKDSSEDNIELQAKGPKLEIGSPNIFTEAPKMIKTVASVPCLRVNSGLVKPGDVKLSGSISSQYLTALLMAAPLALGDVEIEIIDKLISIPYVDMTLKLMERFRVHVEHSGNWDRFLVHGGQKYKSPGNAFVEGDASSASYFLAGAAVTGGTITVVGCGTSSLQNHPAVVVPRLPAGLNLLSPDNEILANDVEK
ncbi:hypothetical protein Ahy_Scaffold8g108403 isoform B [Arachis hypogaea]|uniref:Enolpyruvate transferase domain-containing protein n=1 Tax=Arachis hypogaea TaxID=3818 RepID=A0A444WN51_ARAHY|nr:hypothetical protein Ahy_Scaffold8g108403 isoform B [Arachis hypogaea]